MSCYNWARLHHKYLTPNEVALPYCIQNSAMDPEEMKEWTLDVDNYYDYFPLLKTERNGIIKVYYVNVRKSSDKYHCLSKLIVTKTGKQMVKLDFMSWIESMSRIPVMHLKIIRSQTY